MIECFRCGSLLNRSREHHECYPASPSLPCHRPSPALGKVSNLGFWQEHDRTMRQLAAAHPDLSVADLAAIALTTTVPTAKAA